jgi:hypothetical protein
MNAAFWIELEASIELWRARQAADLELWARAEKAKIRIAAAAIRRSIDRGTARARARIQFLEVERPLRERLADNVVALDEAREAFVGCSVAAVEVQEAFKRLEEAFNSFDEGIRP